MYDDSPWSTSHLPSGGNGNFRTYSSSLPPRIASPTSTIMKRIVDSPSRFCPPTVDISLKKGPEARNETSVPFPIPSLVQSTSTSPDNNNLHEIRPIQRNPLCENSAFAGKIWMVERQNQSGIETQSRTYQESTRCMSLPDQAIASETMRWVRYAARPLHIGELLDAIKIQLSIEISESDMDRICSGLLMKTKAGTVSFVGPSVVDFQKFHNSEQVTIDSRAISATANEMLTVVCLKKLEQSHLLRTKYKSAEISMPSTDIDARLPDLSSYAKQCWRYHYTKAESQSWVLPGMLHEKLRDDWKCGKQIFFGRFCPVQTAAGALGQKLLDWGSMTFLNAALEEGVRSGMAKLAKLELEMGANPNAPGPSGNTPLHFAVMAGNLEIVKLLLRYHGNPNTRSTSGDTPLSLAVEDRQIEVFKSLLNHESASDNTYIDSENTRVSSHCIYQKLSLLVSYSSCFCSNERRFILSKIPNNDDDDDKDLWSPITISTNSGSQAKCQAAILKERGDCCGCATLAQQAIAVKWFAGFHMYKALGKAARGGLKDILRFLIVAGNDLDFLKGDNILNENLSKMQLS